LAPVKKYGVWRDATRRFNVGAKNFSPDLFLQREGAVESGGEGGEFDQFFFDRK
jgi:hypothetical protein